MNTITLIIALISLIMSIVIAIGKGDWLIAGYNTSSKEEKEKVNIKRLRLLTSIILLFVGAFVLVMPYAAQKQALLYLMIAVYFIFLIVYLILANTWCKKK